MPRKKRDGMTMINLHIYDRNLLNIMARAKNETRSQFVSRLLHREAREQGRNPPKPNYPPTNSKK